MKSTDYRIRNAREYTVAMSAEYTAMVCAETMWQGEDLAIDMVEEVLKQHDIEEIDTHIVDEHKSYWVADEYEFRLKVNMVIPVEAISFRDAWDCAVEHIESIEMPDGVELERTDQIDMVLAEEKAYLMREKVM